MDAFSQVHQLAADCGVSIYRCSGLSSGPAGRFGGAKGARRPVLDIRRDIAARRLAEEVGARDASAESAKGGAEEVIWFWNVLDIYPLVNVYIAMERSSILNGKIHYFYGHFQ